MSASSSLRDAVRVTHAIGEVVRVQMLMLAVMLVCACGRWTGSLDAEDTGLPLLLSAAASLFLLGLALGIKGVNLATTRRHDDGITASMMTGVSVGLIVTGIASMAASFVAILMTVLIELGDVVP